MLSIISIFADFTNVELYKQTFSAKTVLLTKYLGENLKSQATTLVWTFLELSWVFRQGQAPRIDYFFKWDNEVLFCAFCISFPKSTAFELYVPCYNTVVNGAFD